MMRVSSIVSCLAWSMLAADLAAQTARPAVASPPAQSPPPSALAPKTVAGTGTYTTETLTYTHGLAWTDKKAIRVALFDHQPRPTILAELRKGSWGDGGPTATLAFELAPGKSGPAGLTSCVVGLHFPKAGPMTWNGSSAAGCGVTVLEGTLTPGGAITAVLKGSTPMLNDKPMAWDLRFNLPVAK